ncbi:MAG: tetratricopeptide repeat protein [bacterium]
MNGVRQLLMAGWLCGLASLTYAAEESTVTPLVATRAALEDGLYDLARKQAEDLLRTDGVSGVSRGDATVLLVRALYGQHRFKEMLQTMDATTPGLPTSEAGALVYWHAVAQFESGRAKAALSEISGFGTRFHGSPLLSRALRLEAWCNLRDNRRSEALELFEQVDRQFGATDEGAANLLDWGQALLSSGDAPTARIIFEKLIKRTPSLSAVQEGKLWLAKALVAEGMIDAAWNVLTRIANDQTVRVDRRSVAWMTLSEVNAVQSNMESAVSAASKSVDLAPTAYLKNRGRALWGRWLLRTGKIVEGAEMLRPVIAELTDDPISGELQLELAATYAGQKQPEKAAEEYQYYLETFSDPAGRQQAFTGRGLALWSLLRYAEASAMFEKAAGVSADPAKREELLVKSADSLYANSQYKLAFSAYQRIVSEYSATALTPQVLFQCADCLARQSLWTEAEARFREVVRRYPDHRLAEHSLMRIAEMKEEQGAAFIHAALAAYADVMNVYPAGSLFPEALQRHGLAAYQIGEIDMALKDFTRVVNEYPKSRVAPQAYFMRGWALYMRGQEEESLKVCKSFVERYPDSEWTPGVMFWMGEYAFNHGSYADAETQFITLTERAPRDVLADQALIWAGRSAMMQKEYLRAVDIFSRVAKAYPSSPRLDEARFLQGDSLSELGEFSRAILVFDDLIAKYPGSALVGAAWGRRGDCLFTLGATDVKRYDEAVTSYRSVARSPGTSFDLELQAEYKIGRCFDKEGRRLDALEQYYTRVVVRYLSAKGPELAAAVWFTKAAFAAADILELEKNWKRAVAVLERVVDARIPATSDARKRIEQIRAEHWLW